MAPPENVTSALVSGRQRGTLDQLTEASLDPDVVHLVGTAHHEPGLRALRDDVCRGPALLDDPVDAGVGVELLPPQADRAEEQDHRVERVLALPWVRGGVGLEAVEDHLDVLRRERVALDVAAVAGMEQEGRVDPLEQAVLDHDGLAAPPFLGRRAEEHDLSGQLVGDRRQRDCRPDPGRGHRVVAAAVAQPGQGVVFGEDPDPRAGPTASASEDAANRGRQPTGRMLDRVTVAGDRFGNPRGSLLFLERHLRVGVDPAGQLDDLVPMRFDGRGEPCLHLGVRRSRLVGDQGHETSRLLGARAAAG